MKLEKNIQKLTGKNLTAMMHLIPAILPEVEIKKFSQGGLVYIEICLQLGFKIFVNIN